MRSALGSLIVLFRSGQRMSSTSRRRTRTTMYSQDSAKLACVQQGREPNPPQQARSDLGAGEFLLLRLLRVTDVVRTDPACICNQSRGDAMTHASASIEVTTGRGTPHSLTLDIPQRDRRVLSEMLSMTDIMVRRGKARTETERAGVLLPLNA